MHLEAIDNDLWYVVEWCSLSHTFSECCRCEEIQATRLSSEEYHMWPSEQWCVSAPHSYQFHYIMGYHENQPKQAKARNLTAEVIVAERERSEHPLLSGLLFDINFEIKFALAVNVCPPVT